MLSNYFNNIINYINEHFVSGDFWFDTNKVIDSHIKKIKFTAKAIKDNNIIDNQSTKSKYIQERQIKKIIKSQDKKEKLWQAEMIRIEKDKRHTEITTIQKEKLKIESEDKKQQDNIFQNLLTNLILDNKDKRQENRIHYTFIDKENNKENNINNKREYKYPQNKESNNQYNRKLLDPNTPMGYVSLMFENLDINKLFIKHNIILKHLKVNDTLYIKSFILNNEKSEYACDNMGENVVIVFREKNDSFLEIIAENILGDRDYMHIINGRLINY